MIEIIYEDIDLALQNLPPQNPLKD